MADSAGVPLCFGCHTPDRDFVLTPFPLRWREGMHEGYIEVYRPTGTQELLLIKLHLDAAGVSYFVANENFSSLLPDLGLADMRLMVAPEHAERCADILRAHLGIETLRRP